MKGVIFDVDGTLVDSNDLHAMAFVEAFERSALHVPFEIIRPLIGMGSDKLIPTAAGVPVSQQTLERIAKHKSEIFKTDYLPLVVPFPGGRELVQRLREEGYLVTVGSSANKKELEPLLEIARVADLLDGKTSSSDAENSKPDPDIVVAALEDLGISGPQALMIGDTPYDIEAARRAGVSSIGFLSGGWSRRELRGAIALYDGPWHLLEEFSQSPFREEAA